ncbi:MAG: ATP-binding cassette domain-containing protein [Burkholderiales bacterium]|nr:ATP-binding cassette domain-containing protein [Burkholderiales bacterium]
MPVARRAARRWPAGANPARPACHRRLPRGPVSAISVDEVARQAESLRTEASPGRLQALARPQPFLTIEGLRAGYGAMEIVHGLDLHVGRSQSLCLIGPNGAGKSTVLHSIFGFARILEGRIILDGTDITRFSPQDKLKNAGIAYVLQDKSIFPQMTVEENLLMGGHLLGAAQARRAAERILDSQPRLAARRRHAARVLSGGERRLLEVSRALVMEPAVLLVDEPSIGLEPRYIDMVFELLARLQYEDGKTILMVEQNAKKGLEFADIGYVLVSGELALAGTGRELLANPKVERLFLGG